ncbi:MAG: hypothetical protein ACF8SC_09675 [Phycisphaerales bacterium JB037]
MKLKMMAAGVALAAGLATTATADEFFWEWNVGDTGVNNNGGAIEYIKALYNEDNHRFVWDVTFSNQITEGYTLAVSPGPNPKGISGELALIYFDASGVSPIVSVYGYNGVNALTSYKDGQPQSGDQTPDRVATSIVDFPFVNEATVTDFDGKRRLRLALNASVVQNHIPPMNPGDWTGLAFGDQIGVWFHPVKNLSTTYGQDGFLASWSGNDGWLDGSGFRTTPTPGALALLGLGGLCATRRKR